MYLMIENHGVSSIDCWAKIGLSSTRGNDDTRLIGKFGSGIKHALMTCLRFDMVPQIYLGKDKLKISTKKQEASTLDGVVEYEEIIFGIGNKKFPSGFTVGFGELDWVDPNMAIREFISNAIDASYKTTDTPNLGCKIEHSLRPTPKDGFTRVFIPITKEFNLNKYFLHFENPDRNWGKDAILSKPEISNLKIYRRGVLVLESKIQSIFDYNFGDIKLDESRNLDQNTITNYIRELRIFNDQQLGQILKNIVLADSNEGSVVETKICWGYDFIESEVGKSIWGEIFGHDKIAIIGGINEDMMRALRRKGKMPLYVHNYNKTYFKYWGIQTENDYITTEEKITRKIYPANAEQQKLFDSAWDLVVSAGLAEKSKPNFHIFDSNDAGVFGYYINGSIYISSAITEKKEFVKTVLEEIAHYLTNARDYSRDFQEFFQNLIYWMAF